VLPCYALQSELQAEADAAAAAAKVAKSPLDVENLMQQNKDKLNMLKVRERRGRCSKS
jgi:hypothetical protein